MQLVLEEARLDRVDCEGLTVLVALQIDLVDEHCSLEGMASFIRL
jgi:hypothetical protein